MKKTTLQYTLNALFVLVLGSVLCGAFIYQMITGEAPCPLCLLQRLAMLGICIGCILNLRFGLNMAHYGLMIFSLTFGSVVSLRQIGLHVCPQFGTFGQPVFGFDLYAWALFVFAASALAISLLLYLYGSNKDPEQILPKKSKLNQITFIYIGLISLAEVMTVLKLCGLSACQG